MADVFISYAAEDRARVEPLARTLETAGLSVWWDRRIGTGSSFDVVIERELDAAGSVLVIWSKHSIGSEWVRNEATEGAERGVLVPMQIDDVRPPLAFRRRQTASLIGWPSRSHDGELREVVDSIRALVGPARVESHPTAGAEADHSSIVVAVLPLADRTAERNMGYLCEGLAEDLMNALFTVEGLRVLSSTDTFAYKHSTATTREIGASLHATVVLEGSVQRAADRIAVSVRLVNVIDGVTIYSERFQRSVDDVFEVQAEIASRAVEGLRAKLGLVGTIKPNAEGRARNPIAYRMLQSVLDTSDRATQVVGADLSTLRMLIALECAIALDPTLERAYMDLVHLYANEGGVGEEATDAKIGALLAQMNAHCPDSPLVWQITAELELDMARLASDCSARIETDEGVYPYAHPTGIRDTRAVYGTTLAHAGLHREAIAYLKLVDRVGEPNYDYDLGHACACHVACRQFEQALALADRHLAHFPSPMIVPTWRFIALVAMGDLEAARTVQEGNASFRDHFVEPLLRAKQSGAGISESPWDPFPFHNELHAYVLLAVDEIERGIALLLRVLREYRDLHWVTFRIPVFSVLFSDRVKRHPGYREALALVRLDDAAREPFRLQAATLTPITGVEVGPLLPL